ncbi:MAG: CDP-alcohol phosphatidyltransferase family protein [Planctomycetota bacterium]|jgi:CDP-diacylglycerol--serine O-phosphatidyltransferase
MMLIPDKTKTRRMRFMRGTRKHRIRTVAMLPSMITLVNGICGFAAIILAAKGPEHFNMAAYLIFYAMIADVLDGRVARISNATSSFGGQLDSMCDVISFGAAPAFMMLKVLQSHRQELIGPAEVLLGDFFARFIWVTALVYLCCAIIRLARFNVENEEAESSHMAFTGLPSPAAAGLVAAIIMLSRHVATDEAFQTPFFEGVYTALMYVLPLATLSCGLLMVSRIRYLHLFNRIFRGSKPMNYLYFALFTVGMIALCGLPLALVLTFGAFAYSGPARWAWRKLRRAKHIPTPHDHLTTEPNAT